MNLSITNLTSYWAHRFKRAQRKAKNASEGFSLRSDLNVTPLVDIVLVLLIIFMVITPEIVQNGGIKPPLTKVYEEKNGERQIKISMGCIDEVADNLSCGETFISMQQHKLAFKDFENKLIEEREKLPGAEIHLLIDKRVPYTSVRKLLQFLSDQGVLAVLFESEPKKELP